MGRVVSKEWLDKMTNDINNNVLIDETLSFNKSAQSLIIRLSNRNKKFKVYNLGAGVKRITTNTDTCPCCGKTIPNKG